jgi:hypothetical protein
MAESPQWNQPGEAQTIENYRLYNTIPAAVMV